MHTLWAHRIASHHTRRSALSFDSSSVCARVSVCHPLQFLVVRRVPSSSASAPTLEEGDVILSIGGEPVQDMHAFEDAVRHLEEEAAARALDTRSNNIALRVVRPYMRVRTWAGTIMCARSRHTAMCTMLERVRKRRGEARRGEARRGRESQWFRVCVVSQWVNGWN